LTLAHRGSKAYSEGFDLVHRREAPRANAIWQADHAQLNILLLHGDGQTARPWLTIVIDDYSRAIAGYYLGFDPPSSMRTALALRQGIWRKGQLPRYCNDGFALGLFTSASRQMETPLSEC
jgi:putative transposase